MTHEKRERWLDYNEELCQRFNDTDDPQILEDIAMTEVILFTTAKSELEESE